MIEVSGVTRRYGAVTAVSDVSFTVESGQIVGLLGPNGAGKTTLMKVIIGYHEPDSGSAHVCGIDVAADPLRARALVGYLPETTPLYGELTVREYLGFMARARLVPGRRRAGALERVIDQCRLQAVVDRRIGELSRGFRQRVGLAQALVHDPAVLILDEPTSGLDPNQIAEVRAVLREQRAGCTVLLSTHVLGEVEALCSSAIVLNEGTVVASGTLAELRRRSASRVTVEVVVDGGSIAREAADALADVADTVGRRKADDSVALVLALHEGYGAQDVFDWAVRVGVRIRELTPRREPLEDVFAGLTAEGRER